MSGASYVLTPTARQHLREAKAWSLARWGQELTEQYFSDLEKTARYLAEHHSRVAGRKGLAGESGLGLHPAREHYIVYVPFSRNRIAIVAFIRQGRDIPALLSRHAPLIRRELDKIKKKR